MSQAQLDGSLAAPSALQQLWLDPLHAWPAAQTPPAMSKKSPGDFIKQVSWAWITWTEYIGLFDPPPTRIREHLRISRQKNQEWAACKYHLGMFQRQIANGSRKSLGLWPSPGFGTRRGTNFVVPVVGAGAPCHREAE